LVLPTIIAELAIGLINICVSEEENSLIILIEIIKYNQFIDFVYDKKKASMGQNKREAILGQF